MKNKLSMMKKMYERLEKTTFINEVFEISSAGEFGTISGFRLGKNQTIDIKWEEVNAAIGQIAYLICVLAHRFKFTFDKYYIHLRGSFSAIHYQKDKEKIEMPLFTTSGDANFNCALECLLDCMKILLAKLERDYV
jgi:beclin 1